MDTPRDEFLTFYPGFQKLERNPDVTSFLDWTLLHYEVHHTNAACGYMALASHLWKDGSTEWLKCAGNVIGLDLSSLLSTVSLDKISSVRSVISSLKEDLDRHGIEREIIRSTSMVNEAVRKFNFACQRRFTSSSIFISSLRYSKFFRY